MRRGRSREEQIIGVLRGHEAGMKPLDLCRKRRTSETPLRKWKPSSADEGSRDAVPADA